MEPFIPAVLDAVRKILLEDADVKTFTGGQIFINDYDELMRDRACSVTLLEESEGPESNRHSGRPDMRKFTFSVNVAVSDADYFELTRKINALSDAVETLLWRPADCLDRLSAELTSAERHDILSGLEWTGSDIGVISHGEIPRMIKVLLFELVYVKVLKHVERPAFKEAGSKIAAAPDGTEVLGLAELETEGD